MNDTPAPGAEPASPSPQSGAATTVKRIFVERALDCDFSKFNWGGSRWRAQWIRAAGEGGARPGAWAFRRRFRLDGIFL